MWKNAKEDKYKHKFSVGRSTEERCKEGESQPFTPDRKYAERVKKVKALNEVKRRSRIYVDEEIDKWLSDSAQRMGINKKILASRILQDVIFL